MQKRLRMLKIPFILFIFSQITLAQEINAIFTERSIFDREETGVLLGFDREKLELKNDKSATVIISFKNIKSFQADALYLNTLMWKRFYFLVHKVGIPRWPDYEEIFSSRKNGDIEASNPLFEVMENKKITAGVKVRVVYNIEAMRIGAYPGEKK